MPIENDNEIKCDRCENAKHENALKTRKFEMKKTIEIAAVLEPSMNAEVKEKNKDLIEFGMGIDFSPLFAAISKKLGLEQTLEFSTPRIYECRGDFYVDCESVNIADRVGVFAMVLDEVRAMFSSSCIVKDEDRGCYAFWTVIKFSYRHIDRGTNGLEFATVWFDNDKGWTFKFVEPQNRD